MIDEVETKMSSHMILTISEAEQQKICSDRENERKAYSNWRQSRKVFVDKYLTDEQQEAVSIMISDMMEIS